ncbi:MAG: hypothetical protein Q8Q09_29570 [Deltaproteobacteria bacterium]|nr:hypothetical protein [Deltaproteobacteria bacterium]
MNVAEQVEQAVEIVRMIREEFASNDASNRTNALVLDSLPVNDVIVIEGSDDMDALLSADSEFAARCDAARDAWINAVECSEPFDD